MSKKALLDTRGLVGADNSIKIDMLHVFVTDKCNMACPHCYVDSRARYDNELNEEEMISLFKELSLIQFSDGIHVEGGEPFLRKDLIKFLGSMADRSKVTIATNGTVSYDPSFDAIKDIARIGFSVEGATQETHAKLRPNNLSKLLDNIVEFQNNGFKVQSRTTLTSENLHEIKGIVSADYERKIPIARFQAFTPVGRGVKNQRLSLNFSQYKEAIMNYIEAVKKFGDKVQVKLSIPTIIANNLNLNLFAKIVEISNSLCYNGCNQAAISANGDVFQCYNLLNFPENKVGNIRDTPFKEIVSSKAFSVKSICPNSMCVSSEKGYTHLINT